MRRAIWLQTATVFWVGGGTISPSYCMFNYDIQTEIHTPEPLVPDPRVFEFELVIQELKCPKSSGIDQIPTELRQAVEQFAIRSINLSFLFGTRMNCRRNGRFDHCL